MMMHRFGDPVNQKTSPACMINKATDQTGGNELINTPNQMSRNATRGRTREPNYLGDQESRATT